VPSHNVLDASEADPRSGDLSGYVPASTKSLEHVRALQQLCISLDAGSMPGRGDATRRSTQAVRGSGAAATMRGASGRQTWNVAPWPGVLVIDIRPP
jgi:hypothetical protein